MQLNSKLQLTAFFMSMLMLNACGGSGGSTAPNPVTPPATQLGTPQATTTLDGSWRTRCQESKPLPGYDQRQIFNFNGNVLTKEMTLFMRDDDDPQTCTKNKEALIVRVTGDVELGATLNSGTKSQHTKINFTDTKLEFKVVNSTLLTSFENPPSKPTLLFQGYELNDWSLDVWKDLSSIPAARKNFNLGTTNSDIFQISKKQIDGVSHKVLITGDRKANHADGRPLTLNNSYFAVLLSPLEGTWVGPCHNFRRNNNFKVRKIFQFQDSKLKIVSFFYLKNTPAAATCSVNDEKFQSVIQADIVLGKTINPGQATSHSEINITTTNVTINPMLFTIFNDPSYTSFQYYGYGLKNWESNVWKDISSIPDAIKNFKIGISVPDIFKISTATIHGSTRKVLKMGDYKGSFDKNGRAMSLEPEGAVFEPE
jgi:hypothetical protein